MLLLYHKEGFTRRPGDDRKEESFLYRKGKKKGSPHTREWIITRRRRRKEVPNKSVFNLSYKERTTEGKEITRYLISYYYSIIFPTLYTIILGYRIKLIKSGNMLGIYEGEKNVAHMGVVQWTKADRWRRLFLLP